MKPISYKQETGDTERLLCPGAPQGPARFQREKVGKKCQLLEWKGQVDFVTKGRVCLMITDNFQK